MRRPAKARKKTAGIAYDAKPSMRSRRVSEAGPMETLLAERLGRLIEALGNNRVASLLGVAASQPVRWRKGQERISAENQRRILDLDYVLARLLQLFPAEQTEIWLTSHNAHLGARPVDVLRLRGGAAVIQAVDVEAQGAYG
jgi:uncharacterized protein (DUF2384 family)